MHRSFAALRMTIIFLLCGAAGATTYYVSSSQGNDSNAGTSASAPWQTIAHVNAQTFNPGDEILFRRGDVWNESLVPSSSGTEGNPIAFDAYGTGPAPNLTGWYAIAPSASAWTNVTGNVWKTTAQLPSTYTTVNFCLFGSIWGQKVAASSSNLTAQWDFYLANGYLYVYAVGNPSLYYSGSIVPMALSNVPMINVNGKTWLTFQHFLVNWFDDYGVYVQGASDHLVFANMEADSLIPQGTQPLGFYVDESAPGPGDVKIYNTSAHMNYDGYRFDGSATAITMVNDNGYANRDGALVDNTSAVTYSYCHFYASSLAVAGSTDMEWTSGTGPIAGAGNIPADTPAAVEVWQRYPARVTLTVDDIGMTPGADTYYAQQVLPVAQAAGIPVGVATTVGYTGEITPLIPEIQGWINSGIDVTAHSISHTYFVNTNALTIQYTGSGTASSLTIAGSPLTLTITVTGANDSLTCSLAQSWTPTACGTIEQLMNTLNATGKFTATLPPPPCQGPYGTGCSAYTAAALLSQDLASVSGQDVKTSSYTMQLNVSQLQNDEITLSRQWMTQNLTGLPSTPVYIYPGGYEDPDMEAIAAGVPYDGARGAMHMGGTANNGSPITGAKDTYASGLNVQDITSFGVNPSWMGSGGAGVTPAELNQKIEALVWKEQVWGVPWGVFWHLNELVQNDPVGGTEITNLIQDFKNAGATVLTNTALVNWLTTGTLAAPASSSPAPDGNYYYKSAAVNPYPQNGGLDFRPTANSPVVNAGENLGSAYEIDLNGINQNSYGTGWEIGAHVYIPQSAYGGGSGSTGSYFTVGWNQTKSQMPLTWVNSNEWIGTTTNTINFPASGTGGGWSCGTSNYGPYTAGSQTSLNQAIADAESCRTANGSGTLIVVPAGMLFSGADGIVLPQTAGDNSKNFIVLTGTSPLPAGQTVCSHGIQDNLLESMQIGVRNPGCTGTSLSYQLGTTVTPLSGSFTLANGVSTSASAYDDLASMWTVQCTGANCNAVSFAGPDANGVEAHHYVLMNMEARPLAGATSTLAPVLMGTGTETVASTLPTHIHLAYDYMHGDWGDAPVSGGVATSAPTGANSLPYVISMQACVYCSVTYSYVDQALRPGAEGHVIGMLYTSQIKIAHNWVEGQSSGTFCGGQASTLSYTNYVGCTDVEDRANRYTYPYSWLLASESRFTPNSVLTLSGGHGTGATVNETALQGGALNAVTVVAGGSGYEVNDVVTAQPNSGQGSASGGTMVVSAVSGGAITSVVIASGSGYTVANGLAVTGGAGSGATVNITSVGPAGEITGVSLASGGSGYSASDNLTVVESGASGGLISVGNVSSGVITSLFTAAGSHYVISNYVRKNGHELKNGLRYLFDGNIVENVDNSGAQNGTIFSAKTTNSSAGIVSANYWLVNAELTVTGNIFRNSCNGPSWGDRSTGASDGNGVAYSPQNALFQNNLTYNANTNNPGCAGSTPQYGFRFATGAGLEWTCSAQRDALGQTATLSCSPQASGYGTQTDTQIGDPVAVYGCADTSFNTAASQPQTVLGPPALPGTNPNGLTIVYANPGTANATTTGCVYDNTQGYPNYLVSSHNSDFLANSAYADDPYSSAAGGTVPYELMRNITITNDIFVGGGINSTFAEGTRTETKIFDTNTLALNNDGIFGRNAATGPGCSGASCYTEYGGPNSGASPPVTIYLTPSPYCTGNDPTTGNCAGVLGAMSASSFPQTLTDWHQFRLCHAGDAGCNSKASLYAAGGTYPATDGLDLGFLTPQVDTAETRTQYTCATACGNGPYNDLPAIVTAANFGMQCAIGTQPDNQVNCEGSGSTPIIWPPITATPAGTPGLLRLHDAHTYWAQLNPASGSYSWTYLDDWLDLIAQHEPVAVSQVFTWTPCWLASNLSSVVNVSGQTVTWVGGGQFYVGSTYWNGQTVIVNGNSTTVSAVNSATSMTIAANLGTLNNVTLTMADPNCGIDPVAPTGSSFIPSDLTASGSPSFNALVQNFVQHCSPNGNCVANLIKYYEMWNEWDIPYHWTNCGNTIASCATMLYQMLAPAAAIIRANVPGAVIFTPSSTPASNTYQSDYATWLNLENTNGRISDWVTWHVYLTATDTTINTPEVQWATYNQNLLNVQRSIPGWANAPWADTETNFNGSTELEYSCPTATPSSPPTTYSAADCAGMIARWQILHDSNGSAGLYWYDWETTIGSSSSYEPLYYWLMQYLTGGTFRGPASYTTNGGVQTWTAPFVEANGTKALWVWTPTEAGTTFTVPSGYVDYRDLSGNTTAVTAGQGMTIGVQPVMLEQ